MNPDAILLAGLLAGLIFLFIVLSGIVKLLEKVSPRFARWVAEMDERPAPWGKF